MEQHFCLRCPEERLDRLASPGPQTQFFRCPACSREYSLEEGKSLTFRWLHPISLVLYGVIFDEDPVGAGKVATAATSLAQGRSDEEIAAFVAEVRLELAEPTQNVRDILECQAPEEELRRFLGLVCDHLLGVEGPDGR